MRAPALGTAYEGRSDQDDDIPQIGNANFGEGAFRYCAAAKPGSEV